MDYMSRTYGIKGPLAYVLRTTIEVEDEAEDPLIAADYYGRSGGLQAGMIAHLSHVDALY